MSRVVTRTWSVTGQDGATMTVTDALEGGRVNVSIQSSGEGGGAAVITLTGDQFEQLFSIVMAENAFYSERGKPDKTPLIVDVPEGRGRFARP
jgi:hypothetical protein